MEASCGTTVHHHEDGGHAKRRGHEDGEARGARRETQRGVGVPSSRGVRQVRAEDGEHRQTWGTWTIMFTCCPLKYSRLARKNAINSKYYCETALHFQNNMESIFYESLV